MSEKTTSGSISFMGLLFITFLVLKLTHVIDWSWWWVTVPLWGGFAFGLIIFFTIIFVTAIFSMFNK